MSRREDGMGIKKDGKKTAALVVHSARQDRQSAIVNNIHLILLTVGITAL